MGMKKENTQKQTTKNLVVIETTRFSGGGATQI
jgi:hypothetical protein